MGDLRGEGGVEGGRVKCRGTLDGGRNASLVSPCSALLQHGGPRHVATLSASTNKEEEKLFLKQCLE
jgi:hypothetical protein